MTEIGFGITRPTWRFRLGFSNENWSWTPGEIESGKSYPAENFDAVADKYYLWGWLCFVVFFAKATA